MNKTKNNKKNKNVVLPILLGCGIIVIILLGLFFLNKSDKVKNDSSLDTMVELALYHNSEELGQMLKDKDIKSATEWTTTFIDGVLNTPLTDKEKETLKNNLDKKFKELLDSGKIEFDENGNLTDISLAYIINAIMEELKKSLSNIDFNEQVLSEKYNYEKIVELEKIIKEIEKNNEKLIESAENINLLLQIISGENGEIDSAYLKELLEALKTLIEMGGYVPTPNVPDKDDNTSSNTNTNINIPTQDDLDLSNATLEEAIEQLQNSFNTMNSVQTTIISDLNNAITNIQEMMLKIETNSTDITKINEEIKNISELLESTSISLTETREALEQAQKDLLAIIEANKKEAEANLQAAKSELNKALEDATINSKSERDRIEKALKDYEVATKEVLDKTNLTIEKNKEEAEKNLQTAKDELKKSLEDANIENKSERDRIEKALKETEEALVKAKKELLDLIEKNKQEAEKNLKNAKDALTQALEEANITNKADRDRIEQALKDYEAATNIAMNEINSTIQANKEEAETNLKNAKEELTNALNESNIYSQSERDRIEKLLKDFMTQTEQLMNEINIKIDANKEEAENNLKNATDSLNQALQNSDMTNQMEREKIQLALQNYIDASTESFANVNASIELTNQNLEQTIINMNTLEQELRILIQKNADDIKALSEKFTKELNDMGIQLTTQINENTQAINELRKQIKEYMTSVDSHSKIDSINNVYLLVSGSEDISTNTYIWNNNGDGTSSVTIYNSYFLGCTTAQVNYKKQYNIEPTYVIDEANGFMKITINNSFVTDIEIDAIVIFHTSDESTISQEELTELLIAALTLKDEGFEGMSVTDIMNVLQATQELENITNSENNDGDVKEEPIPETENSPNGNEDVNISDNNNSSEEDIEKSDSENIENSDNTIVEEEMPSTDNNISDTTENTINSEINNETNNNTVEGEQNDGTE